MMKLRITALALCLSLVLGMALPCALAEDDGAPKLKSAQCALLGDMGSGRILFNIDAYSRREPASLTKIMTLLLAVEAIEAGTASTDDMVTASAAGFTMRRMPFSTHARAPLSAMGLLKPVVSGVKSAPSLPVARSMASGSSYVPLTKWSKFSVSMGVTL